jgi:hypothetical protein
VADLQKVNWLMWKNSDLIAKVMSLCWKEVEKAGAALGWTPGFCGIDSKLEFADAVGVVGPMSMVEAGVGVAKTTVAEVLVAEQELTKLPV